MHTTFYSVRCKMSAAYSCKVFTVSNFFKDLEKYPDCLDSTPHPLHWLNSTPFDWVASHCEVLIFLIYPCILFVFLFSGEIKLPSNAEDFFQLLPLMYFFSFFLALIQCWIFSTYILFYFVLSNEFYYFHYTSHVIFILEDILGKPHCPWSYTRSPPNDRVCWYQHFTYQKNGRE